MLHWVNANCLVLIKMKSSEYNKNYQKHQKLLKFEVIWLHFILYASKAQESITIM